MKKQIVFLLLSVQFCDCKTLSSNFSRKELRRTGKYYAFGTQQLLLKRIKRFIVAENGIGLYIFCYDRNDAEILVPVLKFEREYYRYEEGDRWKEHCAEFANSCGSQFTPGELKEINERCQVGILFSGNN